MRKITTFLISCLLSNASISMENAFYILHHHPSRLGEADQHAFNSLSANHKSIDILISQAFRIRKDGTVAGFVNDEVKTFAHEQHMKLMVLITNAGFDKDVAHQFLKNPAAQKKALQSILAERKKFHFDGIQFDFEGVSIKDKSALTRFYLNAYELLHKHGLLVSFAVVPIASSGKQPTDFLQRKYENWGGAYDLAALGKHSDFITLMAYDQHTQGTTPGPTANGQWVEAVIHYALQSIPAEKISLGVPTYSGYWYIRNKSHGHIAVNLDDISYREAQKLLEKFHAQLNWDRDNKINFAFFQRHWLNEYLFVEDSKSFQAKLELAKKYHLRGVSVFNLGSEDPKIWALL